LRDLAQAVSDALKRGSALSAARFCFESVAHRRYRIAGARLLARLIRDIDFACCDNDGSFLVVFTQAKLNDAHAVARRIAGAIRNAITEASGAPAAPANVTLATLKSSDSVESLMARVRGNRTVAAECSEA
jgi:hypothetical protein